MADAPYLYLILTDAREHINQVMDCILRAVQIKAIKLSPGVLYIYIA